MIKVWSSYGHMNIDLGFAEAALSIEEARELYFKLETALNKPIEQGEATPEE